MTTDGGLRPIFRQHLVDMFWTSIETGGTGRGIADSFFCFEGHSGWIEFKQAAAWSVKISAEQIAWHERLKRAGGKSWIAVRRKHPDGPKRAAIDELWLLWGNRIREVADEGLYEDAPAAYLGRGGPARWNWAEVRRVLTT